MMILAIDPGTYRSAWVLYNPESGKPIFNKGMDENEKLVKFFFENEFDTLIDHLVIEMIEGRGMIVGQDVFETCVWIGRFLQAFRKPSGDELIPTTRIYRRKVKGVICGDTRAKDGNVRQALIDRIGPVGVKKSPGPCYGMKDDMWAALAVAVTFWETRGK